MSLWAGSLWANGFWVDDFWNGTVTLSTSISVDTIIVKQDPEVVTTKQTIEVSVTLGSAS